jgi:hypothetical protein
MVHCSAAQKKSLRNTSGGLKNPVRSGQQAAGPTPLYTLNELPQPQVLLTLGLLNLKPEPSIVSI